MNFACDCGDTLCPTCGPAQGSQLVRVWSKTLRRYVEVVDDGIDGPREEETEEADHEA